MFMIYAVSRVGSVQSDFSSDTEDAGGNPKECETSTGSQRQKLQNVE